MGEVPELLARAGISWRWALPDDLRFVADSWFESRKASFTRGDYCPWPRLAKTVHEAVVAKNAPLLKVIYSTQMRELIRNALNDSRALVLFDVETPTFILGWGHADWVYVKQEFRKMGFATMIRGALTAIAEQAQSAHG